MNRVRTKRLLAGVAAVLVLATGAWAQDALTAKLDPSGMIVVSKGGVELATVELNAHGPEWKYAAQATATAQATDLPGQAGKRFAGTLPIPNIPGGAIKFVQTVRPVAQGLKLEYDLGVTQAMKLNGLQLSVLLPVATYGGKPVKISQPDGEPQIVTLPPDKSPGVGVWSGEGARIEVAKGTAEALTVELRAPADVMVQDLRLYDRQTFELRFPAIMEDQGSDVSADDRFHLEVTITLAGPVKLQGP